MHTSRFRSSSIRIKFNDLPQCFIELNYIYVFISRHQLQLVCPSTLPTLVIDESILFAVRSSSKHRRVVKVDSFAPTLSRSCNVWRKALRPRHDVHVSSSRDRETSWRGFLAEISVRSQLFLVSFQAEIGRESGGSHTFPRHCEILTGASWTPPASPGKLRLLLIGKLRLVAPSICSGTASSVITSR